MKKHTMAFLLLICIGMLLTLSACANTSIIDKSPELQEKTVENTEFVLDSHAEEQPPEPVAPSEPHEITTEQSIAAIVTPERYIKHELLTRYGQYIQVSNETGFPITRLDLFNDSMYRTSSEMGNLLGDAVLEDAQQVYIYLPDYPALEQALQKKDNNPFYLNALDIDGDLYYLEWLPETDPWYIAIPFDALDYTFQALSNDPPEGVIFIENQTGYPLHALFLRDPVFSASIDLESELTTRDATNLLGSMVLQSGTRVQIASEDVPWISEQLPFNAYGRVEIIAQDNEGDFYSKTWYPTTDRWIITVTLDDLSYGDPFDQTYFTTDIETLESNLQILNSTEHDIWYLYALTSIMYEHEELGSDILGDGIWFQNDILGVDIFQLPHIQSWLVENPQQPIHLLGYTVEDVEYHMILPTDVSGSAIELTEENLVPPVY